jgi:hypothetical protein
MGLVAWFKGLLLGGRILRTVGSVEGSRRSLMRTRLKVHVIQRRPDPFPSVGLEFVTSSLLSYQMSPITLSPEAARDLARLIEEALANPRELPG